MLAIGVIGAAGAVFYYLVNTFWIFTADDAFIYLRYSANLAEGHGPTWNPGGPPVEGYVSFLWVMLLAVPHALELDPVRFAKVTGVIASLLLLALSYGFVLRLLDDTKRPTRHLSAAFATLIIACFHPFELHAVSGMATAPFMTLLLAFCYLLTFAPERPTRGTFARLAVVSLLVGLIRAEGILAVAVGLLGVLVRVRPADRSRLIGTIGWAFVLPGAVYFIWRASYYGQLFPLPFYVKTGVRAFAGVQPVLGFLQYIAAPLGLFFCLGLLRLRSRIAPAVCSVASLLLFYLYPLHIMGYAWRYVSPTFPVIAVVCACGVAAVLEFVDRRFEGRLRTQRPGSLAVALLLAPLLAALLLADVKKQIWFARFMGRGLENTHIPLGKKLRAIGHEGAVLALSDAGAVPYYSRWQTVDTLGLNDVHIALTGDQSPEYVLSTRPDLVVVISRSAKDFVAAVPWEEDLYHSCLNAGMTKIGSIGPPTYRLWLMAPPASAIARELSGWNRLTEQ